jgi:hypothetical protein
MEATVKFSTCSAKCTPKYKEQLGIPGEVAENLSASKELFQSGSSN